MIFAYLEASIAQSWWTATLDGFFGMLCFITGLVLFLYLPFRTYMSVCLSAICLGLAIFTKETYLLLWVIFPLFILSTPGMRTRAHWSIAGSTLGFCVLKLLSQGVAGATAGDHIVASVLDIDPELAFQNYTDYGRLLLYGHNILLILLCLIRPEPKTPLTQLTGLLVAILLLFGVSRIFNIIWLMDLAVILGTVYFTKRASYFERIWVVWTLVGLSLVILYDVRIVGGIMNRRVLEPSMGFALFAGCALAYYPSCIKQHLAGLSIRRTLNDLARVRRLPQLLQKHAGLICLTLILLVGIRQQITTSGVLREWRYWIAEGEILRTTFQALDDILPPDAILVADMIPGLQKPEQILDAMVFMFNRDDVEVLEVEEAIVRGWGRPDSFYSPYFFLTTKRTKNAMASTFYLSLISTFTDPKNLGKSLYLYSLKPLP